MHDAKAIVSAPRAASIFARSTAFLPGQPPVGKAYYFNVFVNVFKAASMFPYGLETACAGAVVLGLHASDNS